jgi:hypothetical protein
MGDASAGPLSETAAVLQSHFKAAGVEMSPAVFLAVDA